ncbi:MAG: HAD-IA family hydrolase [Agitococcus sp.]|jgi:phosphoglycolate phosphatase|nr:HAD-IA family hydrolase [Agitococcus sp.]
MSAYKLVIFDWDGTLMDSVAHIVECLQQAATTLEQPVPSIEAARNIIGLGLPEAIAILFPHASSAARESIRQQYAHHFILGAPDKIQLFDGVMPLLTQLSEQGALLAVATGKSRLGLNRVLAQTGLGDYFVATRCADETASKPHPLMLHEILAHTGIALDDAVMIGDTSYDMEMAQQIAMPRIGVSYGVHSVDVLQSYQPLAIVDSIYQLQEFLC